MKQEIILEKVISYIEHVPIWDYNFSEKYAVKSHSSYVQ